MKIFRPVDAGIIADDERSSATRSTRDYTQGFAVRADIAIDGRIGADIRHVDGAGEEGLDGRRSSIETGPLNLYLRTHCFIEPAVCLTNHRLRVGDIREGPDANYGLTCLSPSE